MKPVPENFGLYCIIIISFFYYLEAEKRINGASMVWAVNLLRHLKYTKSLVRSPTIKMS